MKKSNTFSELIVELTELWLSWMKYNGVAKNEHLALKVRSEACDKCEALIDRRYEIVDELDSFFS